MSTTHLKLPRGLDAAQAENSPYVCLPRCIGVEKVEGKHLGHHMRDTKDTGAHRCLANRLGLEPDGHRGSRKGLRTHYVHPWGFLPMT